MSEDNKTEKVKGFLNESLARGNKQIRAERGDAIAEDLEMVYKREIEDKTVDLKRLNRKQANAFDFSPTNSQSLVMGKDFDAGELMKSDLADALAIHNTTIRLNIAKKQYNHLFGFTYTVNE
jgi:hypothetical protein